MTNKIVIFAAFLLFSVSKTIGSTVNQKLYIVADSITTVDREKLPYISYNYSKVFTAQNPVITLSKGDSLRLWIINTDSITHSFAIRKLMTSGMSIPSNDSVLVTLRLNQAGVYIYHDPKDFPNFVYMGLGGMLVVRNHQHASFHWNLKEHQASFNHVISNKGNVDWSMYNPKYFTINGNSHPHILQDENVRIRGKIGDTLIINISNTGRSIHPLHFHGFHAATLYSSSKGNSIGRIKDTYAIYPMETLVLQIVPDKLGEYPIHDHNLVAVTGKGIYPNGMLTSIIITP